MRIVNPSLRKVMQRSQAGEMCIEVQPATYGGIAKKTILFGAVTILAAILSVVLLNVAFAKQDAQLLSGFLYFMRRVRRFRTAT